jgi:hypothetical protein
MSSSDLFNNRVLMFAVSHELNAWQADHFYTAALEGLNGSGVSGSALFALDDDTNTLTVAVGATGLEAGVPHAQHIHGFLDDSPSAVPGSANDTDGDGFIEEGEAIGATGPVLLTLGHGGGSQDNGHDQQTGFPTAPNGELFFVRNQHLPTQDLGADPLLDLRVFDLHGMSVPDGAGAGTPGEVNGAGGFKPTLPVAAGQIVLTDSFNDFRAAVRDADLTGFHGQFHLGLFG